MGLFDSKSRSSADATTAESGLQANDYGQAVALSNIKAGRGDLSINMNLTDNGAVSGALLLADHVIDRNSDLVNQGYTFVSDGVSSVLEYGEAATLSALNYSAGATKAVLESNQLARLDAMNLTAGAFDAALSSVELARVDAMNFSAGAFKTASAASERSAIRAFESAESAGNKVESMAIDALNYSSGAIEFAQESSERAAQSSNDAFQSALGEISKAGESGVEQLSNKVIYGLFGLVGLFLLQVSK
jgi:hypothetical protein